MKPKRIAAYKTKKEECLRCPVCLETTRLALTRLPQMRDWLNQHWFFEAGDQMVAEALAGKFRRWACGTCERAQRALFPDYSRQNYGLGGPILFYISREMSCESCEKRFVFSATEQKFWYEDLAFHYDSYPKRCADCRKALRRRRDLNRQLALLLAENNQAAEKLETIAGVYEQMGLSGKAKLFRARAKNKRR